MKKWQKYLISLVIAGSVFLLLGIATTWILWVIWGAFEPQPARVSELTGKPVIDIENAFYTFFCGIGSGILVASFFAALSWVIVWHQWIAGDRQEKSDAD